MLNEWQPDTPYKLGHTIQFEGEKYQILKKHVSSSEKTPRNSPNLYGIPEKFALCGGAWYDSSALMGSDYDIKRRGLSPGGHSHQKTTNAQGKDTNNTSPSGFSWNTARAVSNIKNMFPKKRESTAKEKGDSVTAPLLVHKTGHAVPDSVAGSVWELGESLYGGDESSVMLGVNPKGD
ncbi:hypothetical protein EDB86DRAFT_2249511 [Lactarius hatsudake]|nr:hypothetical protein EDB86DRAFT_2249511 [Lactarius hatsudake]